ncbi:Coiled-coil domain-containing protein 86 [Fasciola gigantica]|uniref:Coiled-coil domain-containing protein 86 n=1 Tax=Fasciola gigantica TaxID=46835 RepID=A0A504YA31_FASGI|nr:Coiled-coil domain-containing protein 86 [Fasciola gigantica]
MWFCLCCSHFRARYSLIKKDKGLRRNYTKRRQNDQELKRVRLLDQQTKEARADRKRSKRLKEEEKRRRKLENERKSEIVIPLKNPSKIKKMKRSQLRTIVKR